MSAILPVIQEAETTGEKRFWISQCFLPNSSVAVVTSEAQWVMEGVELEQGQSGSSLAGHYVFILNLFSIWLKQDFLVVATTTSNNDDLIALILAKIDFSKKKADIPANVIVTLLRSKCSQSPLVVMCLLKNQNDLSLAAFLCLLH